MTDQDLARQVARAFIMYLGDAQETDTDPVLHGEDGFARYLVEMTGAGFIPSQELHRESEQISELFQAGFTGADVQAGFDDGYKYAYAELGEVCECSHDLDEHNEDGGCRATDDTTAVRCECRAYEAE